MSVGQSLLLVCTGNVCRSPFMEHYLRARFTTGTPGEPRLTLGSAGTRALVGERIDPPVAAHLAALGIESTGFRSRQLDAGMVQASDLVLTAERSHRAQVLQLQPGAHRRVFTLAQADRLLKLESTPPALGAAGLASLLAARRGRQPGGRDDDIPDPFGRPPAFHAAVVAQMLEYLESVRSTLEGCARVAQD